MTETTESSDILGSFGRWLHARIITLEVISLILWVVAMFINVKSESELAWLVIIPIGFLMIVLYFVRFGFDGSKGIPYTIYRFNNFACESALFAIILRYFALYSYSTIMQGAAFLLAVGLIGITIMMLRNSGSKMFTTELLIRTAALELIVVAILLTPDEILLKLGFALAQ